MFGMSGVIAHLKCDGDGGRDGIADIAGYVRILSSDDQANICRGPESTGSPSESLPSALFDYVIC